ncbi:MAG: hypothetical protein K5848_08695 [Lachnospiraceae bacterium]|nr:hypothetical protein [Lachnospiraceae bacterium]
MDNKFTYEVKDFEPTIRKKPLSKKGKAAAFFACLAVIGLVIAFALHLSSAKRGDWDTAYADFKSHAYGEDSKMATLLHTEDWYRQIRNGCYEADASIKLTEVGDLGLGIEEYAEGAGLAVKADVDMENLTAEGVVQGTWTVVAMDLFSFMKDKDEVLLSSEDFLQEDLYIDIIKAQEMAFSGFFKDFNDTEVSDKLVETKKSITVGERSYKCSVYEVTVSNPAFPEDAVITAYVNRKNQIVRLVSNYNNGIKYKFTADFTGESHPSDRLNLSLEAETEDWKISGELEREVKVNGKKITITTFGYLNLPTYTIQGNLTTVINSENGDFTLVFDGNDGFVKALLNIEGNISVSKDELLYSADKISFEYGGVKIFTAEGKVKFKNNGNKKVEVEFPAEKRDISLFNSDDFNDIKDQILGGVEVYMDRFGDLF